MKLFARNLIFFLAIVTAILVPIAFFLGPMDGILSTKSKVLLSNRLYTGSFYVHVVLGGIALLIGWVGFVDTIRRKYLKLHRIAGRVYVICFLITALSSIMVSYHASGGLISQLGFMSVGIVAVFTTAKGYTAIVNRKIEEHQAWMCYSYACCLASVTLRLWMPLFSLYLVDDLLAYRIVAWLSWMPNLIVVKMFLIRKQRIETTISI